MSGGYSSKIYKKRKNYSFHIIVVSLILISSFLFFRKEVPTESENTGPDKAETKSQIKEKKYAGDQRKKDPEPEKLVVKNDLPIVDGKTEVFGISIEELLKIQNRAIFFTKKKQYRKAIDEYNTLLTYDKRFMTIIGMCQFWLHEYEQSVITLKDADDLGNFPFRTKKFLAFSLYELNKLSESKEYALEALKFGTDSEIKELIAKLNREENVMRDYKDLGTENFLIQFSREEHDQLRTLMSDYLKEAYKEIGKKIDYFPNKQFVVILYNERDFFDVTRAPGWAGGLYDGKIRLPVKGITGQDDTLRRVIFHEYTHALISEITQRCPLWVNEGLAEYFSSNIQNISIKKPIPLKYLEKRFPSNPPGLVSLAYLTSYSAVEYLIDKYGMYSILELLEEFEKSDSINAAFESVLYVSYEDFLSDWNSDNEE